MDQAVSHRLDRLERENRFFKAVGLVALAVIAAVVLMGQATTAKVAKVIEAEKFVVKDKDGKARAVLEVDSKGWSWLRLTGPDTGIWLRARSDGVAILSISGADGTTILTGSDLSIRDHKRRERVNLGYSHISRGPGLILRDAAGMNRAKLALDSLGVPYLQLYDKSEVVRSVLGTTSLEAKKTGVVEVRPESSLVLFNKAGKVIWKAP